ncbi:MAG: mandelate racemase/muconate lactonizing enzyme family protein [Candidatus Dormiibacterota bacterium]
MRITDVRVETYDLGPLDRPYRNSILTTSRRSLSFVHVDTDEGLTGTCFAKEASTIAGPLRDRVLGEDPLNAARLWHRMFTGWRKPVAKGDAIAAIGALDNALWDLRGKILRQPVYRLLGGFRDRVPAYAAGGYYEDGKGPLELGREMAHFVEAGYRAVKMKIGGAPHREDCARVQAAREAIGPDVQLMIDANDAWTAAEAIRFGRAVEQYDISWFEEPCWPDDLEGAREVCAALDMPVASGEIEYTRWGCRDLIERRAADIVQADPQTCGGLTEWVRVAALASAHHLPVSPHGNQYVGAHAVAAVENGLIVESYARLQAWQDDYLRPIDLQDGEIVLPQTPGIGLEIDTTALRGALVS